MIYALAEKRCENFDTCDTAGVSEVNTELLTRWETGRDHLAAFECVAAENVKDEIVPLMAVPLIQGVLRCVWGIPGPVVLVALASPPNSKGSVVLEQLQKPESPQRGAMTPTCTPLFRREVACWRICPPRSKLVSRVILFHPSRLRPHRCVLKVQAGVCIMLWYFSSVYKD